MVPNAEWLVAAHQDELIRDAEQARLIRSCRAQNAGQGRWLRKLRSATDNVFDNGPGADPQIGEGAIT
jgi:hypothetical protein